MTTTSSPLTQDELKAMVGQAALRYIAPGDIVGVGTGSTVNKFIDALATMGISRTLRLVLPKVAALLAQVVQQRRAGDRAHKCEERALSKFIDQFFFRFRFFQRKVVCQFE